MGADLGKGGDHGFSYFYCLAAKWISQFHSNLCFNLAAKTPYLKCCMTEIDKSFQPNSGLYSIGQFSRWGCLLP